MNPTSAYNRLNKLLWFGRLPKAIITPVEDSAMPSCYGLTILDNIIVRPVILLNANYSRWGKTLVHEMLHVAEPRLRHGKIFDALVDSYWRIAKSEGFKIS